MYTFSFLLLPVALAVYFTQSEKKTNIILLITGFLSAILIFALKEFLTLSHRVVPFSLSANFLYLFFKETLIPIFVLYILFFLLSKDEITFKIEAFFPLVASYYVVFLPYNIITSPVAKSAFEILFKPILFLNLLICMNSGLSLLYKGITGKKLLIPLGIFLLLISLPIPAITEAFFLIDSASFIYIILTIISILFSAGMLFFTSQRK